ncbi:MAG: hypothetical protein H7338_21680, partial [Candidatus Sericytochromatia bacterium]|nr:hypothetical protein [Candidatus Sericytochromatia bacterium]
MSGPRDVTAPNTQGVVIQQTPPVTAADTTPPAVTEDDGSNATAKSLDHDKADRTSNITKSKIQPDQFKVPEDIA